MWILFGTTALWMSREKMMLENLIELIAVIKNESILIVGRKLKYCFFLVSNGGWPNEIENDQKFSKITQKWSFLTI